MAVERAVGDQQRDVAAAGRQIEGVLELVLDDPHPGEPLPDVSPGVVEPVIVVPLERRPLGSAVLEEVIGVGLRSARPQQQVVPRLALREAGRDATVEREAVQRRQPPRLAVELGAIVPAVQVDRQLARLPRQLVDERDPGLISGPAADRRPREGPPVGPHLRPAPGQDAHPGLADRDPQVRPRAGFAGSAACAGSVAPRAPAPPPRGRRKLPGRTRSGSSSASAPPPRAPRKARRPKRRASRADPESACA